MIKYIKDGNIFNSHCSHLVNPVNCVGIMGAGLAAEFKRRYPDMFKYYKSDCNIGAYEPGKLNFYTTNKKHIEYDEYQNTNVICFPTKLHWRDASKTEYIETGLQSFVKLYKHWNVRSVAFPALGCGLGNLRWEEIKPLMEKYLSNLDIEVEIYE